MYVNACIGPCIYVHTYTYRHTRTLVCNKYRVHVRAMTATALHYTRLYPSIFRLYTHKKYTYTCTYAYTSNKKVCSRKQQAQHLLCTRHDMLCAGIAWLVARTQMRSRVIGFEEVPHFKPVNENRDHVSGMPQLAGAVLLHVCVCVCDKNQDYSHTAKAHACVICIYSIDTAGSQTQCVKRCMKRCGVCM